MRLKSAVAACLFKRVESQETDNSDTPFTLLVGDLSGIQKYVFGITEGGKGETGTGKRLRSRSLFVQLLAEVGMQKALAVYDLPPANILMASGGKFHILWPNLPEDNEKQILILRKQTDQWLLNELHGEIGLTLAITSIERKELYEGFGDVFKRIREALHNVKNCKLSPLLQNSHGWNEKSFVHKVKYPYGDCPSCRKFPATGPEEYCRHCELDRRIGEKIAHQAKWLALYHQQPDEESLPVLNDYVSVLKTKNDVPGDPYLLIQLGGEIEVSGVLSKIPALWRPSAPHVGELDFVTMARNAEGRELLGDLKADVDHLGAIFQCGFKKQRLDIPARFSTLSRQLDRF